MNMLTYISYANNGLNIIKSILHKENKDQIIDPFSTIIRLGLLSYKPLGTKIGISNNSLRIFDVSILQGTYRTITGDQKEDLMCLDIPIEYACMIYLNREDEKMLYFFNKAKDGLQKLMDTYIDYPTVRTSINNLIIKIDKYISNQIVKDNNNYNSTILDELKIRTQIYETIKKYWDDNRIDIIYKIMKEIDSHYLKHNKNITYDIEQYIEAADSCIKAIDKKMKHISNTIS